MKKKYTFVTKPGETEEISRNKAKVIIIFLSNVYLCNKTVGYLKVESLISFVIPACRESFSKKDSGQARMTKIS